MGLSNGNCKCEITLHQPVYCNVVRRSSKSVLSMSRLATVQGRKEFTYVHVTAGTAASSHGSPRCFFSLLSSWPHHLQAFCLHNFFLQMQQSNAGTSRSRTISSSNLPRVMISMASHIPSRLNGQNPWLIFGEAHLIVRSPKKVNFFPASSRWRSNRQENYH